MSKEFTLGYRTFTIDWLTIGQVRAIDEYLRQAKGDESLTPLDQAIDVVAIGLRGEVPERDEIEALPANWSQLKLAMEAVIALARGDESAGEAPAAAA